MIGAGTEPSGWTLSVITFQLLSNPDQLRKLKEEFKVARLDLAEPLRYSKLKQLPYLVSRTWLK